MSTLEFFGAAVGLMRVCSEGRVGEHREKEDEKGRGEEIKVSGEEEGRGSES